MSQKSFSWCGLIICFANTHFSFIYNFFFEIGLSYGLPVLKERKANSSAAESRMDSYSDLRSVLADRLTEAFRFGFGASDVSYVYHEVSPLAGQRKAKKRF